MEALEAIRSEGDVLEGFEAPVAIAALFPGRVAAENVVPRLPAEPEEGVVEYKLQLGPDLPRERLTHLATQMNWRLNEAGDAQRATYMLGVQDDGKAAGISDEALRRSLEYLGEMAALVEAEIDRVTVRPGLAGKTCEVAVSRQAAVGVVESLRMGVLGMEGSGKSTLIGVLSTGTLDNARGLARMQVLRHNHEVETGRTSSISATLLGFDAAGRVVNHRKSLLSRKPLQEEIVRDSDRVLTVFDCAGHEKYLKTTVFGVSASQPDYILLVVDANRGIQKMTREHLGVALALQLPLVVVMTKCDVSAPDTVNPRLARTWAQVQRILRSRAAGHREVRLVASKDDVDGVCADLEAAVADCSAAQPTPALVPCFHVSNVTGHGHDALRAFLARCPATRVAPALDLEAAPVEVRLEDVFQVEGEGTVFSASVRAGTVAVGDKLLLGPLDGWLRVAVRSIHVNGVGAPRAVAGQAFTLTLTAERPKAIGAGVANPGCPVFNPNTRRGLKRLRARKGLVLLDLQRRGVPPTSVWEFEAEVVLLHHPNGIVSGYEAVIHAQSVRQSARLLEIIPLEAYRERQASAGAEAAPLTRDPACAGRNPVDATSGGPAVVSDSDSDGTLRPALGDTDEEEEEFEEEAILPGGRAVCRFRFLFRPEFVYPGTKILIREGTTRGVGSIVAIDS